MLRLRPLGHLSADKIRYNIACARGECKQENGFFEKKQNIPPIVPIGIKNGRPGDYEASGRVQKSGGNVPKKKPSLKLVPISLPDSSRARSGGLQLVCDFRQTGEHGGAFGRGKTVQELFAETFDAPDAFVEKRLTVRGERDLNRAAVFRILDSLEEILFHKGLDELGHGCGGELHGLCKLLQRDAVRFFLGKAADQRHRLVLTNADVDRGKVSDGIDRFTKCIIKA